jgi:ribosomal subunit interface protein
MHAPVEVVFRDIPQSAAVETEIRRRAEKLDDFFDHIMRCHVAVETDGRHQHQGRQYKVRVTLKVPGSEIIVNGRHRDEDVFVAIRDTFDAAGRQLEDYVRRMRGDVKTHDVPLHGRITRLFPEGYGFLETAGGDEFYFHRDNVVSPGFDQLEIDTEVQFLKDLSGQTPQAKRVNVGKHHVV